MTNRRLRQFGEGDERRIVSIFADALLISAVIIGGAIYALEGITSDSKSSSQDNRVQPPKS